MLFEIEMLFLAYMLASLIMLAKQTSEKKETRSAAVIIIAFVIFFSSVSATIIIKGANSADINIMNLDTGQVYYLNDTVSIPDNAKNIVFVVIKWDISKERLQSPVILAIVNKELIGPDVETGKYIIKNSQGKIVPWMPPVKN